MDRLNTTIYRQINEGRGYEFWHLSSTITLDRSCDKMALINYTKYNKKNNGNKYKNNWIKLKNEVGMVGSKSTQTRDNCIYYYISVSLLFEGHKNNQ